MSTGVVFPTDAKGKRSTTAPGKEVWTKAFTGVCDSVVEDVKAEKNWRYNYHKHTMALSKAALKTPEASVKVAQQGLEAVYDIFEFARDGQSIKLSEAMENNKGIPLTATFTSKSESLPTEEAYGVDFEGKRLAGSDLVERITKLVNDGQAEPDVLEAFTLLESEKKAWREQLKDTYFVLLGATSELCPFVKLMELGLNVVAVARPNAKRQASLINTFLNAPAGASLTLPVLDTSVNASTLENPEAVASVAGADMLINTPEVKNWLVNLFPGKRLVIGSYIYLDGADHVRASVAMDAVAAGVLKARPETALTYLGTPSSYYPIPRAAAEDAKRRQKTTKWWSGITSTCLGPYVPITDEPVVADALNPAAADQDTNIFVFNGVSTIQGPNYLLAKSIQLWRAVAAREAGATVSINMAPVCRTDSVMHVPSVARAVRGMSSFPPLDSFAPETCMSTMALLLIYDMNAPQSAANPKVPLRTPLDLVSTLGVHGGLWRTPYTTDSTGKTAYLLSYFK
mmetsp:Transcript_1280/g.2037  ORF Transcript_1280/g.2037 Transcript_1280/m.2037 type:complete len:513 (-) Transcript_1280:126-1664(-)